MSERDQDFEDARRGFIAALDPAVWSGTRTSRRALDRARALGHALRLPRPARDELIAETVTAAELVEAGWIEIEGDGARIGELFGLMPEPRFAIVTP